MFRFRTPASDVPGGASASIWRHFAVVVSKPVAGALVASLTLGGCKREEAAGTQPATTPATRSVQNPTTQHALDAEPGPQPANIFFDEREHNLASAMDVSDVAAALRVLASPRFEFEPARRFAWEGRDQPPLRDAREVLAQLEALRARLSQAAETESLAPEELAAVRDAGRIIAFSRDVLERPDPSGEAIRAYVARRRASARERAAAELRSAVQEVMPPEVVRDLMSRDHELSSSHRELLQSLNRIQPPAPAADAAGGEPQPQCEILQPGANAPKGLLYRCPQLPPAVSLALREGLVEREPVELSGAVNWTLAVETAILAAEVRRYRVRSESFRIRDRFILRNGLSHSLKERIADIEKRWAGEPPRAATLRTYVRATEKAHKPGSRQLVATEEVSVAPPDFGDFVTFNPGFRDKSGRTYAGPEVYGVSGASRGVFEQLKWDPRSTIIVNDDPLYSFSPGVAIHFLPDPPMRGGGPLPEPETKGLVKIPLDLAARADRPRFDEVAEEYRKHRAEILKAQGYREQEIGNFQLFGTLDHADLKDLLHVVNTLRKKHGRPEDASQEGLVTALKSYQQAAALVEFTFGGEAALPQRRDVLNHSVELEGELAALGRARLQVLPPRLGALLVKSLTDPTSRLGVAFSDLFLAEEAFRRVEALTTDRGFENPLAPIGLPREVMGLIERAPPPANLARALDAVAKWTNPPEPKPLPSQQGWIRRLSDMLRDIDRLRSN